MTKQEINKYRDDIHISLEQKKLKKAFQLLASLLSNLQNWQLQEKLNSLEDTYRMMLQYYKENVVDPQRETVYNNIIKSLYTLTDSAVLQIKTSNDNSLFFERKRSFNYYVPETQTQLFLSLEDIFGKIALLSLLDKEEKVNSLKKIEEEKEKLYQKIFYLAWLSDLWDDNDKDNWLNIIKNELDPIVLPSLIVSGITLNLLEVFDEKKALVLFESAFSNNEEVRERALTGIILFLRKYDKRLYLYPSINSRLNQLMEDSKFTHRIRHILLQFILSKETEKITKKIKDELLPEMMKMGPKIGNKIKLDELMNEDTGIDEKNPEWQNIIEEAGLQDKLQELTELQMEGADVMHSSFTHLKNYPFFNEPANWLLPFSIPSTAIGDKEMMQLAEVLVSSTMLCNSDKFSFYLSVSQMPESYRKMMIGQLSAETDAMKNMLKEELKDESKSINFKTRQYIQDLYRFFKLHPRKNDFEDIFDSKPEFYKVPSIFQIIKDIDNLFIIGEYYFNKNYFTEASEVFDLILQSEQNNDILYQKKGYCMQMDGNLQSALDCYEKAELLNANNSWTIKKIAYCYRALKKPEQALLYYKKAEKLSPENMTLQLNIGHCFLELKNYDEALKYYFKVEYLTKNKEKAWRPIAWCSFLIGKYEQAMDYFNKIIDSNPNFTDYLNAGHIQLAMNNVKKAIDFYKTSWELSNLAHKDFMTTFSNDIPYLITAGINEKDIPFILDCLFYEM